MAIRVTTRSRPRTDRPIPYEDTTAAAAGADDTLTGPFTLAQVAELLFRVRKLRMTGEISHDRYIDPPPEEEPYTEPSTTSIDYLIARRYANGTDDGDIPDELMIARESGLLVTFAEVPASGTFFTEPGDIAKDETGGYWLRLNFSGGGIEAGDGSFSSDTGIVGDTIDFDATLTLGGADFTIPAKALAMGVTAASLTITVEEWWPYATSSGSAAWNTTTGAPVNGGPGA